MLAGWQNSDLKDLAFGKKLAYLDAPDLTICTSKPGLSMPLAFASRMCGVDSDLHRPMHDYKCWSFDPLIALTCKLNNSENRVMCDTSAIRSNHSYIGQVDICKLNTKLG